MLTYFQHFFIIKIFFDLFLYFFQLFSIQQKATKKIRLLSMLICICAWAFPKLKPRISITYSNAALRWFWQLRVKKNGQDQLRCWLWTRFDKSISVGAQQSELCSLGWAIFSTFYISCLLHLLIRAQFFLTNQKVFLSNLERLPKHHALFYSQYWNFYFRRTFLCASKLFSAIQFLHTAVFGGWRILLDTFF